VKSNGKAHNRTNIYMTGCHVPRHSMTYYTVR